MNGPDETAPQSDHRGEVSGVAAALRTLHRSLVDASRAMYELDHGPVVGPNAMLQLLMVDPEFAWLRELSGVMAEVDELLDLSTVTREDAAAVRILVERLLGTPSDDASFGARYREALQANTDVVIAHGKVRSALGSLPLTAEADLAAHDERRKGWPVRRIEERRR